MKTEKLDVAFESALQMPAESDFQSICRATAVKNVLYWYQQCGVFYPPMNSMQRDVFEQCQNYIMEIKNE